MNNAIKLEYPAEASRIGLPAYIAKITAADPALLVAPTIINQDTIEEKYAVANSNASATITSSGTNVTAADTVTINGQAYRFESSMSAVNDVLIGGTAAATLQNLVYAINGTGTPGVNYYTGTVANAAVQAVLTSATVVTLTALAAGTAGNSITFTKSATTLTITGGGDLGGAVAGPATATATAQTAFQTAFTAIQTAFAGNPLGEGIEGLALSTVVSAALTAAGINNNGLWVTTGNSLPAGISEGDEFNYDLVTLSLADFVALVVCALELNRARTILTATFTANGK